MPNQLFNPKTLYAVKSSGTLITGNPDNMYLPSPRHQIMGEIVAGAGTAGASIQIPTSVRATTAGGVSGSCFVLNIENTSVNYGVCSQIVDYKPDEIVMNTAGVVAAGEHFSVFYNKPDGAILFFTGGIDKNDLLDFTDAGGRNHFDYPFGKPGFAPGYAAWQPCVGWQVTKLWKNSIIADDFHFFYCAYN